MKQLKNFSLAFYFLMGSLLVFSGACKKSNDNPGDPLNLNPWNGGTLSANIAGNNWSANAVYAVDSSNLIVIVAGTNNGGANDFPALLLVFPDNTPEGGTVHFDITKNSMLHYIESQNSVYYAEPAMGGSGSITVTKFNKTTKRIEGNFTASLKNAAAGAAPKALTGGKFAVNYR